MVRKNIPPILLRGSNELSQAIGISDERVQKSLRDAGMPHGHDGKSFVYDPEEIK